MHDTSIETPPIEQPLIEELHLAPPPTYKGEKSKMEVLNDQSPSYPDNAIPFKLRQGQQATHAGSQGEGALSFIMKDNKIISPEDVNSEDVKDAFVIQQIGNELVIKKGSQIIEGYTKEDLADSTVSVLLEPNLRLGITRFDPETNTIEVYKVAEKRPEIFHIKDVLKKSTEEESPKIEPDVSTVTKSFEEIQKTDTPTEPGKNGFNKSVPFPIKEISTFPSAPESSSIPKTEIFPSKPWPETGFDFDSAEKASLDDDVTRKIEEDMGEKARVSNARKLAKLFAGQANSLKERISSIDFSGKLPKVPKNYWKFLPAGVAAAFLINGEPQTQNVAVEAARAAATQPPGVEDLAKLEQQPPTGFTVGEEPLVLPSEEPKPKMEDVGLKGDIAPNFPADSGLKGNIDPEYAKEIEDQKYTVKEGDYLNKVAIEKLKKIFADKFTDDDRRLLMFYIAEQNKDVLGHTPNGEYNPDSLSVGTVLKVPSAQEIMAIDEFIKNNPEDDLVKIKTYTDLPSINQAGSEVVKKIQGKLNGAK